MKFASIGSNCIDLYHIGDKKIPYAGGGPINVAVYLRRLGACSAYVGAVGKDEYGSFLIEKVKKEGVDLSHVHILEGKTAITHVTLDKEERILGEYEEGVLEAFSLSEEDITYLEHFDVVICDIWGHMEAQFETLKRRGIKIAFDCANYQNDKRAEMAIPFVDMLFFSSDLEENDLKEEMKRLLACGPSLVIATRGEVGSLAFDGKAWQEEGIVPVEKVVDTMGAGDSYMAGFLYQYQLEHSISKAMKKGSEVASQTLTYYGAW